MNRIIKLLLSVFVLVALSCDVLSSSLPISTPSTSESPSNAQVNPTSVSQTETQPPSASNTQCDGDKWTFDPQAVYRYPQGNGIDLTIVDLAIHNGSDKYWGSSTIHDLYITTEGGYTYTYTPYNYVYENIPTNPKSPYSGTSYRRGQWQGAPLTPPGFTTLGIVGSDVSSGDIDRFTNGFEIASSQKALTLHIKVSIFCKNPEFETISDWFLELSYSLDNLANYALPTSDNYPDLGSQPIIVPDVGTFVYKGQTEQEGLYVLHFSFANANGGYSTSGSISAYLVGDDGLIRSFDAYGTSLQGVGYCSYDAGPAQTVDVNPCPFKIPPGVSNLKFVFVDETNGVYEIYNFVP
jgi:hypothetical protein